MPATCPRCGYDLSGAITAWDRLTPLQCPIDHVCSECGLGFAWRDILNSKYTDDVRHFEHAKRKLIRAWLRTASRSFRPLSYWSWLKLQHRISWIRIIVYLAVWVIVAAATTIGTSSANTQAGAMTAIFRIAPEAAAELRELHVRDLWTPILGPLLDATLKRPDFMRFWWYPFASIHAPGVQAVIGQRGLMLLVASLVMPLAFHLIPTTVRRCKVRRSHLWRIVAYSMPPVVMLFLLPRLVNYFLFFALPKLEIIIGAFRATLLEYTKLVPSLELYVIPPLILAWMIFWWASACGRYLKIPQPWLVASLLLTVSVLATILVTFLLFGPARWLL